MDIKIIAAKRPRCMTCGKLMDEWLMGQEENEHIDCAAERIAKTMIEGIKKDFEKIKQKTAK